MYQKLEDRNKDEQIKKLQDELQSATRDLLEHTQVVEDMKIDSKNNEGADMRLKIKQLEVT